MISGIEREMHKGMLVIELSLVKKSDLYCTVSYNVHESHSIQTLSQAEDFVLTQKGIDTILVSNGRRSRTEPLPSAYLQPSAKDCWNAFRYSAGYFYLHWNTVSLLDHLSHLGIFSPPHQSTLL